MHHSRLRNPLKLTDKSAKLPYNLVCGEPVETIA
jgi:hypothetical protein